MLALPLTGPRPSASVVPEECAFAGPGDSGHVGEERIHGARGDIDAMEAKDSPPPIVGGGYRSAAEI